MTLHLIPTLALLPALALLALVVHGYLARGVGHPEESSVPVAERGRVTLAIPAGGVGRVRLSLGGRRRQHPARHARGEAIASGEQVLVVGRHHGLLLVEALGIQPTEVPHG